MRIFSPVAWCEAKINARKQTMGEAATGRLWKGEEWWINLQIFLRRMEPEKSHQPRFLLLLLSFHLANEWAKEIYYAAEHLIIYYRSRGVTVRNRWCKRDFQWLIGGEKEGRKNNFRWILSFHYFPLDTFFFSRCRSTSFYIIPRAVIRIQFTLDCDWAKEKLQRKANEISTFCERILVRQVRNGWKAVEKLGN